MLFNPLFKLSTATSMQGLLIFGLVAVLPTQPIRAEDPPPNFKVAFMGDQGLGPTSESCLKLIKDEGAQILVHLGDFDYADNPVAWEAQTDKILGSNFLQVAVEGNHDLPKWTGQTGYGALIKSRFNKLGVPAVGEVGKNYSFTYKGIFFVFTTPGLEGTGHDTFIRDEMAKNKSAWRISNWHVLMHKMQAGTKPDESGWPVYEESRIAGAIIATAHEHSYFRSHLISNMTAQTVVSKDSILTLKPGQTFAFVSGLGGKSIRPGALPGPWAAKVYTASDNAVEGAMFGVFNVDGNPRKANFYFKAVDGKTIDHFTVLSEVNQGGTFIKIGPKRLKIFPKRFGLKGNTPIKLADISGRAIPVNREKSGNSTFDLTHRSGVFLVTADKSAKALGKILVLP